MTDIEITYGGVQGSKGDKGDTGSDGTAADTGTWITGTAYAAGDRCYHAKTGYGQCVYRCKTGQGHTSGASTEPEIGASWGDKWEIFASGGADATGDLMADGSVAMTGAMTMTQVATPAEPAASKTAIYPKSGGTLAYYANGSSEKIVQEKADYMIAFCLHLGGAVLTTGVYPGLPVPADGTITAARAISNDSTSGSIAVDLWLEPYADAPPADADSITASAPVTITTSTKSEDTTLTGWSKTLAAGDFIVPNIDSVTSLKVVTVYLTVARS